jgi:hypothetical protein
MEVCRTMRKIFAVAMGSVAALVGFADAANAAPKMYQGSLILHFFGNDRTDLPTPPFDAYVFTALPLGARCNPAVVGGMTCSPTATLQVGAPLTGSGTTSGGAGSPASIMLPSGQLARITSGSFPPHYSSVIYQKTYANLANAAGKFQTGGGPGSVSYFVSSPSFGARIIPGKNQFGGVMRLLKGASSGGLGTKIKYTYPATSSMYVFSISTWGATFVGATSNGGIPASGTVKGTLVHTTMTSLTSSYTGMALGWPWTTGSVRVYAYGDGSTYAFPETLARAGYDNRTSQGGGTIQLVTPHLEDWGGATGLLDYGAIGILRIKFVPEPSGWVVLTAGLGLLGVLYRLRTPKYRSSSAACRPN